MNNIDRWFILTGLVFLLIGMVLGLHMSKAQDFTLHGLHAHLNLLGFVVMTLFGLCYRTWPRMQEGKLAAVHYVLHTLSTAAGLSLLFYLLSNFELAPRIGPIMDMTIAGTVVGVVLFFYLFFTRARE